MPVIALYIQYIQMFQLTCLQGKIVLAQNNIDNKTTYWHETCYLKVKLNIISYYVDVRIKIDIYTFSLTSLFTTYRGVRD